ncbi:MAG: hypothetical protein LDL33_01240 [Desulfomonile sp.]|nr:hypothetical protein [Desulfomonile sp.]
MTARHLIFLVILLVAPAAAFAQVEMIEIYCSSCGFSGRFHQGAGPNEIARNIQYLIVVCERTREVRSVKVPINPDAPTNGEPLLARQYGTGVSKILGIQLPKFLLPGTTCPLFPVATYLEANLCPLDGLPGVQYAIVQPY